MIATVKLAPLERWCDFARTAVAINNADAAPAVGMSIRILTETARKSIWCDGKAWMQEDSSIDEIRVRSGLPPRRFNLAPRMICEHMLEMD